MRLPRARLTVGRVVLGLAAIGLVVGAVAFRRRSVACLERAALHASERSRLSAARDDRLREARADPSLRAVAQFDAERHRVAITWRAEREREARHAAWRPWVTIPPEDRQPPWPPIPPVLYAVSKPKPSVGSARLLKSVVEAFLFHPLRYPQGEWAKRDPTIEVAWFRTRDGLRLNGWFAAAKRPRLVILYCEGSAGNITSRRWVLDLFRDRMSASVLIFDYRGYGRSEGSPSQEGVLEDARAARRWLAERAGVAEKDIVVVGNSLGGAVAVDLAVRDGARGLVLENTFTSLAELTERHFGRVARMLVTDHLDSASKIGKYAGPLLQAHGDADSIVPYDLGRRLFDGANEPKRFVTVPDGDHNDPPTREYLDALEQFLNDLAAKTDRPERRTGG